MSCVRSSFSSLCMFLESILVKIMTIFINAEFYKGVFERQACLVSAVNNSILCRLFPRHQG